MLIPPINLVPFTTMHELNADWLLTELVRRFNYVVEEFNKLVTAVNELGARMDDLEEDYADFKEQVQQTLDEIQAILDKFPEDKLDELLALADNLRKEISDREAADQQLQANIDTEKQERIAADDTLQNNITAEAEARQNADTNLQNNIDAAEQKITSEISNRQLENQKLQAQIDQLEAGGGDAGAAITQLRADLAAETSAREEADDNLQTDINNVRNTTSANAAELIVVKNNIQVIDNREAQHYIELAGRDEAIDRSVSANTNDIRVLQDTQSTQGQNMTTLLQRQERIETAEAAQDTNIESLQTLTESHTNQINTNNNKINILADRYHFKYSAIYDIENPTFVQFLHWRDGSYKTFTNPFFIAGTTKYRRFVITDLFLAKEKYGVMISDFNPAFIEECKSDTRIRATFTALDRSTIIPFAYVSIGTGNFESLWISEFHITQINSVSVDVSTLTPAARVNLKWSINICPGPVVNIPEPRTRLQYFNTLEEAQEYDRENGMLE